MSIRERVRSMAGIVRVVTFLAMIVGVAGGFLLIFRGEDKVAMWCGIGLVIASLVQSWFILATMGAAMLVCDVHERTEPKHERRPRQIGKPLTPQDEDAMRFLGEK